MKTNQADAAYVALQSQVKARGSGLTLQKIRERVIECCMFLCARFLSRDYRWASSGFLISESWHFFENVSIIDFLTDTQWTVLFENPRYGILPLVTGTLVTSGDRSAGGVAAGNYHCHLFE